MLFIKSLYGNDLMNSQILCRCAKLYRSKIGAAKMKNAIVAKKCIIKERRSIKLRRFIFYRRNKR